MAKQLKAKTAARGQYAIMAAFIAVAAVTSVAAVCAGSVPIRVSDISSVLISHIFNRPLPADVDKATDTILWTLRVPRVILAFTVGASLGVSGVVMQAVLRNPLASSYTIGVSAGASLGVGTLMMFGVSFPILGMFGYPLAGCIAGIGAITLSIFFSSALDRNLSSNTIVLVGMVFSLFISALITLITALNTTVLQRLTYWQMGSFNMREWSHTLTVLPVAVLLTGWLVLRTKELDILTFGDEQAALMGINVRREKWLLLYLGAALTGASISFVGIISFVDLVAPHIVRRVFGAKHKIVLPMTAVCGGVIMVFSDIIARTVLPGRELPVGVVTALIGAPFFAFVFFKQRRVN
ncbi:MAG: iron ABC transporter permease [Gracilibacteraceae bacterium]|jgi:iron complex transport system permease protein|nr:iron ABC transporter permease [Gracilibacteraceae bacterium]